MVPSLESQALNSLRRQSHGGPEVLFNIFKSLNAIIHMPVLRPPQTNLTAKWSLLLFNVKDSAAHKS